jgi:hypothetical protein
VEDCLGLEHRSGFFEDSVDSQLFSQSSQSAKTTNRKVEHVNARHDVKCDHHLRVIVLSFTKLGANGAKWEATTGSQGSLTGN